MRKQEIHRKRFLLVLIAVLFFVLCISIAIHGYSNLKIHSQNHKASILDTVDQRIHSLVLEINDFPRSAGEEIGFLSKFSGVKTVSDLIQDPNNEKSIEQSKEDFLLFLKENTAYYQLRYLDETGQEIIRVEFDGDEHIIVEEEDLQDKSDRDYFIETMKLERGEIFFSKLELNIEGEEVENRGTRANPVYIPVIRYAAPVFDESGEKKGIMVSNIYADYFLEDIRRSQREGEAVYLIDNNGHFLAHPDKDREFSFMFEDKDDNFFDDYAGVNRDEIHLTRKNKVETENFIFTFEYIYPTATSFEVHEGAEKVFGENSEDRYYWILVSATETEIIEKPIKKMERDFLYFLFFRVFMILLIFYLIIIGFKAGRKRK